MSVKRAWCWILFGSGLGCGASASSDPRAEDDAGQLGPCAPDDHDGDGHAAVACDGDDCDDGDPGSWIIAPAPPGSGIWPVEAFEPPAHSSNRTVAITADAENAYHVVVADQREQPALYFQGRPGAWVRESIEARATQIHTLAVAADGSVHGAVDTGHLTNASGHWTVEPFPDGERSAKLAVDAVGGVHLGYRTAPLGTLVHATDAPGGWETEVVSVVAAGNVEIAIGPDARVHLLFTGLDGRLLLASGGDVPWEVEDLGSTVDEYSPLSLAVAPNGTIHAAFADGSVHHISSSAGSWIREDLPIPPQWGGMGVPSMALDPLGRPRIAGLWPVGPNGSVGVGVRLSSGWVTQVVASAAGSEVRLTIDSEGGALLASFGPTNDAASLQLASTPGLDWLCAR